MKKKSHPIRNFFILVLFAALVYLGYYIFNDTDVFIIKDISMIGNHQVTESDVKRYLKTAEDIHYFKVNPYDLKKLLEEHPWVKTCEVKKIFPDKLEVTMIERIPVVALYYSETYLLVDEDLYVLSAASSPGAYYPIYGFEVNSFNEGKPILSDKRSLLKNIINTVYLVLMTDFQVQPEIYVKKDDIIIEFTDQFKANIGDGDNTAFRFHEVAFYYNTLMEEAGGNIDMIHGVIYANHDASASFAPFGE